MTVGVICTLHVPCVSARAVTTAASVALGSHSWIAASSAEVDGGPGSNVKSGYPYVGRSGHAPSGQASTICTLEMISSNESCSTTVEPFSALKLNGNRRCGVATRLDISAVDPVPPDAPEFLCVPVVDQHHVITRLGERRAPQCGELIDRTVVVRVPRL